MASRFDRTRRTLRSVVQFVAGLAVLVPVLVSVLVPALGVPETAGWVVAALGVAAAVTRIMQAPGTQPALRRLGLDVREAEPDGGGS